MADLLKRAAQRNRAGPVIACITCNCDFASLSWRIILEIQKYLCAIDLVYVVLHKSGCWHLFPQSHIDRTYVGGRRTDRHRLC